MTDGRSKMLVAYHEVRAGPAAGWAAWLRDEWALRAALQRVLAAPAAVVPMRAPPPPLTLPAALHPPPPPNYCRWATRCAPP